MTLNKFEQNALNISNAANSFDLSEQIYKKALKYYNDGLKADALDYLTTIGKDGEKFTLPAKQRRVDRLTPRLRYLKSRENVRRIPLSVKLSDKLSIDEKISRIKQIARIEYLNRLNDKMQEMIPEYDAIDDINLNYKQYYEQYSQEYIKQGYNPEQVKILVANTLKEKVDELAAEVKRKTEYLLQKNKGFAKLYKQIEDEIREEYVDELERKVDIMLRSFIDKRELDLEKQKAFEMSLKTAIGAEYYYVDITGDSNEPTFEALSPLDVIYPKSNNTWVQDCDWVVIKRRYTPRQLEELYSINGKVKELLANYDYINSTNAVWNDTITYSSSTGEDGLVLVNHIFWKEKEIKSFALYPNKYNPDSPHIHMVDDKEKEKAKRKNIPVKELPYYALYEAVVWDDMFILPPRRVPDAVRFEDSYRSPKLPVIGLVFDNQLRKPYSLVLETKDAAELSTIVNLKMELMITLSGVKGMIMDDSQRPSNMSRQEWMYFKKMGTAWIQSMKNGRPASYNQFQSYDDTLPQSIVTLLQIDESLERHFDIVTGVTRQSLAMMEQYELKGTTMAAINQTLSIVESIYQTHELIYVKALEHYVNLILKFTSAKGIKIDYEDQIRGYIVEEIIPDEFEDRDIKVSINKSIADDTVKELYKQIAINGVSTKTLPIKAVSAVLTANSFREMDKRMAELMDEYEERVMKNQMAVDNNKAEQEASIIKLKGEIDKLLKEYDLQIEQMKLQQEADKFAQELNLKYLDMQNKGKAIEQNYEINKEKNALTNKNIETEKFVELSYLKEQQRQSVVNAQLESIKLKLDMILKQTGNVKNTKVTKAKEQIKD